MPGLDRPLGLAPRSPIELKMFIDDTVGVIYAQGKIALSVRMYNLPKGSWDVFIQEGAAHFLNLRLSVI